MDLRGVAIANTSLSTAQIVTQDLVLNLDAGNTASYSGSGTTWSSLVSPQYDATLVNAPVFTAGASGSFDFDGINQYAEIAHTSALKPTAAITMEQWITAQDWTAGTLPANYLVSLSCTQGGGYSHNIWEGTWRSYVRALGVYQIPTADVSGFLADSWHHAVTTFDGQYTRLYFDGVQASVVDAGSAGNPIQYAFNNSVIIAAEAGSSTGAAGQYWNGRVAVTRIYSSALSASQVFQNYLALRGRYQ